MDNALTPKKIQRLIQMAEDKSFNMDRRTLLSEEDVKLLASQAAAAVALGATPGRYENARCESSSGILDLEHIEGFGESTSLNEVSLSQSAAFNPGEMTGRSTGTTEVNAQSNMGLNVTRTEEYGRRSLGLEPLANQINRQTNQIQNIMRHSLCDDVSFHLPSKPINVSADDPALPQMTHTQFSDTSLVNNSTSTNLSVGSYFKKRCPQFNTMLGKSESLNKSSFMMPSITEVSSSGQYDREPNNRMDETLDCIPVRQPRAYSQNPHEVLNQPSVAPTFKEPARLKDKHDHSKIPVAEKITKTPVSHSNIPLHTKPCDLLKNLQQSSIRFFSEDTESSENNSLSVSKIADYLGKQSNISLTEIMSLNSKKAPKKQPLAELHLNTPRIEEEVMVTHLADTKKGETTSSVGTTGTVIPIEELNINVPKVLVTEVTSKEQTRKERTRAKSKSPIPKSSYEASSARDNYSTKSKYQLSEGSNRSTRSKSPSSRSPSTVVSTVRDNYASFKSGDSPNCSRGLGEANRSKLPSPNVEYKELDKSVDWRDVLRHKQLAKEHLAEIVAPSVEGFVGVSCPVTFKLTTLTDSWLTARFEIDDITKYGKDLSIELPRLPILLSPQKSTPFTCSITSNIEISTKLPFTFYLKDSMIDGDVEEKGEIEVTFKLPVIQAMSADGLDKVIYPPIREKSSFTKCFVIISECPADLQLKLSIEEGNSMFFIKSVQEVKKSDINKVLMERDNSDDHAGKSKNKSANIQLCRLEPGNAIKVITTFNSPTLADLQISSGGKVTFSGALYVSLISGGAALKKIDLIGTVGIPVLTLNVAENKIHLSNQSSKITVTNTGTVTGVWLLKHRTSEVGGFPFQVTPTNLEIPPLVTVSVLMSYTGPQDCLKEATIIFQEVSTGEKTALELSGGSDAPKPFPIKTNHRNISWVRQGRKEISLKNTSDSKVYVRCRVFGDGFSIDLPGVETGGVYVLSFEPRECRVLSIVFTPNSYMPFNGFLHIANDKDNDISRKVKLFGCNSGESMRWSGLVTYSDTALVRAAPRQPVELQLFNKARMPAFVAARVHFNLQYMSVEAGSTLFGARRIIAGRAKHTVSLQLDWPRLERRARECASTALATLTVLTGAEFTRRRILKVVRDESNGELDISLLPPHLHVLATKFDGEDSSTEDFFKEFNETKMALPELIGGLQELTAHIDLPQDFGDDHTIMILDDTVIDHHTIVE